MHWEQTIKTRYAASGESAFDAAERNARAVLEDYFAHHGIEMTDQNPEGKDWMLLLADGRELYVHRSSYEVSPGKDEIWLDYSPEDGGVVIQYYCEGKILTRDVLVSNHAIVAVSDDWE